MSNTQANKKTLNGVVVGNKMEKVVKVSVDTPIRHPKYSKIVNRRKTFFARHEGDIEVGTKVTIRESRPLSKKIRWVVVNEN